MSSIRKSSRFTKAIASAEVGLAADSERDASVEVSPPPKRKVGRPPKARSAK